MFSTMMKAVVATALFASANAHMIMKNPPPFGQPDNSPLSNSGANFPCKVTGDAKSFFDRSKVTTMAVGAPQTLSFTGSAVHGGGSCQLAVTSDLAPTVSSSWQVILSIEGGCPSKDGSAASDYEFTIPPQVAPGDYTFAWTWISKLSGQPEYYMNCAPITVTGGSKRDVYDNETISTDSLFARDDAGGALAEMFVANLASVNDCKTTLSSDTQYPNPGAIKQSFGSPTLAPVQGSNCVSKGQKEGAVAGGSAPAAPADGSSSAASGSAPSAPAGGASSLVTQTTGGSFATASSAATATAASSGNNGQYTAATTLATSTTAAANSVVPIATGSTTGSGSGAGSNSTTPVTSAAGQSGPCSTEGQFNCDGKSYQQCASGSWTAMQALPGGTTCTMGASMGLWGRDTITARKVRGVRGVRRYGGRFE